jgi:hypothetical protein
LSDAYAMLLPSKGLSYCLAAQQLCLFVSMDIVNHQYSILSWNIRGLSRRAKQEDVKQLVSMCKPDLIC